MRMSLLWSYLRMYVWCAYTWDLMHGLAMCGLAMYGLAWFYSLSLCFAKLLCAFPEFMEVALL